MTDKNFPCYYPYANSNFIKGKHAMAFPLLPKEIHHTFSNIAAIEEFDIDDVIKVLEDLRDRALKNAEANLECERKDLDSAKTVLQSGKPGCVHSASPISSIPRAIELHNAVLVAKDMKEEGSTKVRLNSKKDLAYQILAMVKFGKLGVDILPDSYRNKLEHD